MTDSDFIKSIMDKIAAQTATYRDVQGVVNKFDPAVKRMVRKVRADVDRMLAEEAEKAAREADRIMREAQAQVTSRPVSKAVKSPPKTPKPNKQNERFTSVSGLNASLPGGSATTEKIFRIAERGDPFFTRPQIEASNLTMKTASGIHDVTIIARDGEKVLHQYSATVDRFGGVLTKTKRSLQPFSEAVAKDAMEFLKWSMGIMLIMLPLQKMNEMIQIATENQTRLVDVLVAVGSAQSDVNNIFTETYKIAQQTGEAIGGVIDAYSLSYRATGGAGDATERFAIAGKLLSDSLILSKLSTLDQAEAIDVLSAALKQTSTELEGLGGDVNVLEKGQILLDKWVQTTKVANVSLDTLATGFSIVSDAAGSAGLSIDELNGVIATVSEVTGDVSGKEVGNMVRSLVSGFQSDKAVTELQSLGIAINDTTGEARSFMEVYGQIAQMQEAGILSPEQVNKITFAIGGGTRRQAIVQSFISQFGRIDQIVADTADSTGAAMGALDMQLSTVSTASTRLGNSFASLAQTLGTKGGLLDSLTGVLKITNGIVVAFDKVTGAIGRVAPILALALAGSAYNKYYLSQRPALQEKLLGGAQNKLASVIQRRINNSPELQAKYSIGTSPAAAMYGADILSATPASVASRRAAEIVSTKNIKNALSGLVIGGAVLGNLTATGVSGKDKSVRIGADIAGGITGALIGGPIGAALGASIAEAFVNSTMLYESEFANFFKETVVKAPTPGENKPDESDAERRMREQKELANTRVYSAMYGKDAFAGELRGKAFTKLMQGLITVGGWYVNPINKAMGKDTHNTPTTEQIALKTLKFLPEFLVPDRKQLLLDFERLRVEEESLKGIQGSPFVEAMKGVKFDTGIQKNFAEEILNKLLGGKITPSAYGNLSKNVTNMGTVGQAYYTGFGQQYQQKTGQTQNEVFEDFARIITYASDEEKAYLTELNTALATNYNAMKMNVVGTEAYNTALENYNTLAGEATAYTIQLNEALLAMKELPEIFDFTEYQGQLSSQDLIAQARQAQQIEYRAAGFTDEEYQAKIKSFDDFLVKLTDTGYSQPVSGLDPKYLSDVIAKAIKEGMLASGGLGFQEFDMTMAEFNQAMSAYDQTLSQFASLGYEPQQEAMIMAMNDGIYKPQVKDWKIVQYLLGKIEKNTEQLSGIYNLPSGVSAYITTQAAEMWRNSMFSGGTGEATLGKGDWGKGTKNTEMGIAGGQAMSGINTLFSEWAKIVMPKMSSGFSGLGKAVSGFKFPEPEEEKKSLWDKILEMFSVPGILPGATLGGMGLGTGFSFGPSPDQMQNMTGKRISDFGGTANKLPATTTTMNLNLNNTTTILLDGRQVAQVVKRYLQQDLARYGAGNAGGARYTTI